MIRNLIVTNIPKTEEAIKNTLHFVKEYTWVEETINEWLACEECDSIYYSGTYHCYMWSTENKTPKNDNRNRLTYKELVKC